MAGVGIEGVSYRVSSACDFTESKLHSVPCGLHPPRKDLSEWQPTRETRQTKSYKACSPHSSSSPSSSPTPFSTLNTYNHVLPICSRCNLLRYASITRCFGLALDLPDTTLGPSLKGAQLEILSEPAIKFLVALHKTFDPTRKSVRMILPLLLYASVASFPTSFPPHSLTYLLVRF